MMMNYRATTDPKQAAAKLAVLLGLLSILLASALLKAQEPSGARGGDGEHGDNPVVGSLPIEVDPQLDLMFGGDPRSKSLLGSTPVFALEANKDGLETWLLDASGVPNGRVNAAGEFTILGLVNGGVLQVSRGACRGGKVRLSQWLPRRYLGGQVTMTSNIGDSSSWIGEALKELPLQALSVSPAPVVDAWITVQSGGLLGESVTAHILMVGEVVTLQYMP